MRLLATILLLTAYVRAMFHNTNHKEAGSLSENLIPTPQESRINLGHLHVPNPQMLQTSTYVVCPWSEGRPVPDRAVADTIRWRCCDKVGNMHIVSQPVIRYQYHLGDYIPPGGWFAYAYPGHGPLPQGGFLAQMDFIAPQETVIDHDLSVSFRNAESGGLLPVLALHFACQTPVSLVYQQIVEKAKEWSRYQGNEPIFEDVGIFQEGRRIRSAGELDTSNTEAFLSLRKLTSHEILSDLMKGLTLLQLNSPTVLFVPNHSYVLFQISTNSPGAPQMRVDPDNLQCILAREMHVWDFSYGVSAVLPPGSSPEQVLQCIEIVEHLSRAPDVLPENASFSDWYRKNTIDLGRRGDESIMVMNITLPNGVMLEIHTDINPQDYLSANTFQARVENHNKIWVQKDDHSVPFSMRIAGPKRSQMLFALLNSGNLFKG